MMTLNPSPSENVVCLGGLRDPSQHLRDKEPPTVACMLFVSFGYMHLIFPDLLFSKFTSIGVTLHMKLTLWQKKTLLTLIFTNLHGDSTADIKLFVLIKIYSILNPGNCDIDEGVICQTTFSTLCHKPNICDFIRKGVRFQRLVRQSAFEPPDPRLGRGKALG